MTTDIEDKQSMNGAAADLPSIGVIIPCYNCEPWIGRAIDSVLDQEVSKEIIVIDDGSTDNSLAVIGTFGQRILWRTGPNQGACAARNRGLSISKSDYLLFLDADDYIESETFRAWQTEIASTEPDLLFGPFAISRNGIRISQTNIEPHLTGSAILSRWLNGQFIPPCSVLWRRDFLTSLSGWNVNALIDQDGELVLRALLTGARVAIATEGCGIYVQHESPGRISKRTGFVVKERQLTMLRGLWELAQARGFGDLRLDFAAAFYQIAYEAYANEIDGVGSDALRMARALGLRGHIGSPAHRSLSSVFGLRRKLQLSGFLKGRRMDARLAR
jgi:glycosyltransferase involved in cell wall biosynthesis